jgi:N-carbamoyl-L-amino-acid hydrolase
MMSTLGVVSCASMSISTDQLRLEPARLLRDLDTLATFVEPGVDGWTRRAFSPAFDAGRRWLADRMRAVGLSPQTDAAGNLIGRRLGAHDLPTLVIGSHTDTVPGAGRFDGTLGVLAGLEIARALHDAGPRLRHPLEVADFLAEEPTPFGVCCVGSMAMAGQLAASALDLHDGTGRTLAAAIESVGGSPGDLRGAARGPGAIAAYLELHVEQGRRLELAGAPIGAVSGIVGIRRANMRLVGRADHAGAATMTQRRDALAAAAELVLTVERLARETPDAVATVGRLGVSPNQANVVPATVALTVEARSLGWAVVEQLWGRIVATAESTANARGVTLRIDPPEDASPMPTPGWLLDVIERACAAVAPGAPTLPSGSGHDAMWVGRIAPAGMIFVRSRHGRGHCPEEFSSPEDIAAGLHALAWALLDLDARLDLPGG